MAARDSIRLQQQYGDTTATYGDSTATVLEQRRGNCVVPHWAGSVQEVRAEM